MEKARHILNTALKAFARRFDRLKKAEPERGMVSLPSSPPFLDTYGAGGVRR